MGLLPFADQQLQLVLVVMMRRQLCRARRRQGKYARYEHMQAASGCCEAHAWPAWSRGVRWVVGMACAGAVKGGRRAWRWRRRQRCAVNGMHNVCCMAGASPFPGHERQP